MRARYRFYLMIKFLLDLFVHFEKSNQTNDGLSRENKINRNRKKLWFLFSNRRDDSQLDYYCPRKHFSTRIEDLCFYFYRYRKVHKSAGQVCKLSSHRLATIDSFHTLNAVVEAFEKFLKSLVLLNESKKHETSFRFHLDSIYKQADGVFYWNSTHTPLHNDLMCAKTKNIVNVSQFMSHVNSTCVELIVNDLNYRSNSGEMQNACLKLIDCNSIRYAICEWKGHTIQNYNLQLEAQLVKSYGSILVVFLVFVSIWILLYYFRFKKRFYHEIQDNFNFYIAELSLFNRASSYLDDLTISQKKRKRSHLL